MNKDVLDKAIELRRQLHQHPEPSMEENRTKNTLLSFLREHTNLEIRDRGRWRCLRGWRGWIDNPSGLE